MGDQYTLSSTVTDEYIDEPSGVVHSQDLIIYPKLSTSLLIGERWLFTFLPAPERKKEKAISRDSSPWAVRDSQSFGREFRSCSQYGA